MVVNIFVRKWNVDWYVTTVLLYVPNTIFILLWFKFICDVF